MRVSPGSLIPLAVAAALGGACIERDDGPETWLRPELGPVVAVGGHFAQVEWSRSEIWIFNPDASLGSISADVVALDDQVIDSVASPTGALIVLTEEEPSLVVIDPSAPLERRRFELPSNFDSIDVSPDGRFVIAWFSVDGELFSDSLLFTPNQIAIVDLDAPEGGTAVRGFTLVDSRPRSFHFAPPFTLSDPNVIHRYAVAFADDSVSLIDLTGDDNADRQRIVPLAEPGGTTRVRARQVIFSDDDPSDPYDMKMFVLAEGASEVFAVDLLPADPATGRVLQPAINQMAAGVRPGQMHAFRAGGRDKLLVVDSGAPNVTVIDVDTSNTTTVRVERQFTTALMWTRVEAGVELPAALLFQPGTSVVYFAELEAVERQGTAAMRAMSLSGSIGSVSLVPGGSTPRAVVRYAGGTGIEVINLAARRVVALPARVALSDFVIRGDWLFAVASESARLLGVELTTSQPFEVEIVSPGTGLTVAGEKLIVRHSDSSGWLSAYGVNSFTDGSFAELYAYALVGLYDRDDN